MSAPEVVVVGSFVQDLAFLMEQLPAPGETRIGTFRTGPGGKGFNQAVACHRQGARTAFIGACGNDLFAAAIREFIIQEKITAFLDEIAGESTGTAGILVDKKGQNSIAVALGANNRLSAAFVEKHRELFSDAPITLVQAECNLEATAAALRIGRAGGGITILNPAPINSSVSRALLADADILTPNETEFQHLLQTCGDAEVGTDLLAIDPPKLHALACRLGAATLVITLGAQGAFVAHNPDKMPRGKIDFRIGEAAQHYLVPAIQVNPRDTTGAGDAFSGGLAAGIVKFPKSFISAVRYATIVAGLSTERFGTAPAMPSKAEAEARFQQLIQR